jgi:predicted helicase
VNRIEVLCDPANSDDEVIEKFALRNKDFWKVSSARENLRAEQPWEDKLNICLYRPFDNRFLYYSSSIVHRMRFDVMRHLLKSNLALCIGRAGQVTGTDFWDIVICSSSIIDLNIFYRGGAQCFPLYHYPSEQEIKSGLYKADQREPNISPEFIADTEKKLGLKFIPDGKGDLISTFGPEDIFNYAYAVFHSPTYRTRYAEFLKIDFPRLPVTADKALFKVLADKGEQLAALHLMELPLLEAEYQKVGYPASGSHTVEKVSYDEKGKRVYINKEQYFEGIEPEVWNFHIGGYQVCEKWLKDRKGRILSPDDINHYQKVVIALRETIRLMNEIDEVIPAWPIE